jgi:hypothetical protein
MSLLMMVLVIGFIIGIALFVTGLICWIDWSLILIGIIIMLVCGFGASEIVENAPYRDINSNNIVVEYARVNEVTDKTIVLDNTKYVTENNKAFNETFNLKYPIRLSDFSIGDIVKYQLISTDFDDYLIRIEKVQ